MPNFLTFGQKWKTTLRCSPTLPVQMIYILNWMPSFDYEILSIKTNAYVPKYQKVSMEKTSISVKNIINPPPPPPRNTLQILVLLTCKPNIWLTHSFRKYAAYTLRVRDGWTTRWRHILQGGQYAVSLEFPDFL